MTEFIPSPSRSGSVVLNLGAGLGALVLHTPASMDGQEIEISAAGAPRTHSQVRERRAGGVVHYAAVYPDLAAGDYVIWRDEVTAVATVTVPGGEVATCHWPA